MNDMKNIYKIKVMNWLYVRFRLYYEFDNITFEFSDAVIKDKNIFVASVLGSGETKSVRTLELWDKATPCLDWEKIKGIVGKTVDFIPERIKCDIDTYFNFDYYPHYNWVKEIAESMKKENTND